jgi:hypothetical protein
MVVKKLLEKVEPKKFLLFSFSCYTTKNYREYFPDICRRNGGEEIMGEGGA